MAEREKEVFQARLAEQTERFEDMVASMKRLAQGAAEPLTNEERNLLAVAYKHAVGTRRTALRTLKQLQPRCDADKVPLVTGYAQKIENELTQICQDVKELLDGHLIPKAADPESKVFYLKMKGDYFRYLAEALPEETLRAAEQPEAVKQAAEAYEQAFQVSTEMPPAHPVRLGLALNYSVFFFEICNNATKACDIAKQAFDNAMAVLEQLDPEMERDSTLIMQLLRDNLTLWTSSGAEDEQAGN